MVRLWLVLVLAGTCLLVSEAVAQQPPPQPAQATPTQPTPPIAPKVQETLLPPPVELPPPSAVPPDIPSGPITADQAVQIALKHQPNVAAAVAGVAAAQGRTEQARSALRPTLGTSAGYTHTKVLASTGGGGGFTGGGGRSAGSISGFQASADVRQLIYDAGHTRSLVNQAASQQQGAARNLDRVRADLVLQVKQAFYTYMQDQRLVAVNEANVRAQQDHLALARARLDAGVGLPSDVVRAETAVADAILNLTLARNAASNSRVQLAQLMGLDGRTPIQTADSSEPLPAEEEDVAALVNLALQHRPEVLQAQAAVQASEYALKAARTTNTPAVAASVGVATSGASFPPGNQLLSIGASVSWDPFDGGFTAGRVKEAQANLEAAQAQLTSAQQAVISDVSQAYLNLKGAEQRVATAQAEVANAQESVRLAEGRYRGGVGIFLDVVDAQAALLTANTNAVNAQAALNVARAALAHAIGTRAAP